MIFGQSCSNINRVHPSLSQDGGSYADDNSTHVISPRQSDGKITDGKILNAISPMTIG